MAALTTWSAHYAPAARAARLLEAVTGDDLVVVAVSPDSTLGKQGARYAVQRRETAVQHGLTIVTRPTPSPTRPGEKIYDFDGFAGCVTRRKSRATGTLVGVYHADQAGLECDPELRWFSVCEEHNYLVGHRTMALAMSCTDPREWCDECRAEAGGR